ncbi:uncharacterized protein PHACADRAFT_201305 [Phanerochaete carnosa HHB-10118-sp]|uniref:Uncharacterized protein n=1 Tax=Phanerochaete carnosa (strain HHB-10118-sp) TaxID=650164 RepID=K5VSP5_PHACS|nr:uncharacterized protein PHACADRAFT_201305 [Phanerochaete carnosa HHB-10118-sp]EKM49594.1 hypothetical protein PHACADRAFT_201305 [Phanerochaete carnosa HHB-10118-sp]
MTDYNGVITALYEISTVNELQHRSRRQSFYYKVVADAENLYTISSFIHMEFDQFMKIATNGMEITELTGIGYAVHLRRPLFATQYLAGNDEVKRGIVEFAAEKLLNGL